MPTRWKMQGSCTHDDSGFMIMNDTVATLEQCIAQCHDCVRCRYVSFAASVSACIWYAHCDLDDLRFWWPHVPRQPPLESHGQLIDDFQTVRVRQHIPAVAQEANRTSDLNVRLAIATMALGNGHSCGLVGWCAGAARLKRVLERAGVYSVSIVALYGPLRTKGRGVSQPSPAGCPEADHVRVSERLSGLIGECEHARPRHASRLHKWALMNWNEYHAVLFADVEVNICPSSAYRTPPDTPPSFACGTRLARPRPHPRPRALAHVHVQVDLLPYEADAVAVARSWRVALPRSVHELLPARFMPAPRLPCLPSAPLSRGS